MQLHSQKDSKTRYLPMRPRIVQHVEGQITQQWEHSNNDHRASGQIINREGWYLRQVAGGTSGNLCIPKDYLLSGTPAQCSNNAGKDLLLADEGRVLSRDEPGETTRLTTRDQSNLLNCIMPCRTKTQTSLAALLSFATVPPSQKYKVLTIAQGMTLTSASVKKCSFTHQCTADIVWWL